MSSAEQHSKKVKKGFSTAEVILSMFVLSTGLVSVMALISKSLKYAQESRDVIIATELAQEGIELVRNVRDNDFAKNNNGFTQFGEASSSSIFCRIDYTRSASSIANLDCSSIAPSSELSRYHLQYQGGFYGHFNASPERFSRYLFVDLKEDSAPASPGTNEQALARSFVYWGEGAPPSAGDTAPCTTLNKCVFTELYLTSWK